jgi:ssDNA-binding replication factor A large subunit
MAGMRDVELNCKVIRKYDLRTFENARGQGKVFKFLVGDDSGVTMVVLWNDKADFEKKFKENDLIKLKQVSIRDNNGRTEIHVGDGGEIEVNPKGVIIETQNNFAKPERKKISELKEKDENVEYSQQ